MRIRGWEIRVGNTLLEDKTEQNIAFYLMMYGKWEYGGGRIEVDEAGVACRSRTHRNPGRNQQSMFRDGWIAQFPVLAALQFAHA